MKIRIEQNSKRKVRIFDEDNVEQKLEGYEIDKKSGLLTTLKIKPLIGGEVN